jgi:hypothetical protein
VTDEINFSEEETALMAFLRDRFDADYEWAASIVNWGSPEGHGIARSVLADIEAKRRVLSRIVPAIARMARLIASEWDESEYDNTARDLLILLAQPYREHPDYDTDWESPYA